MLGRAGEGRVDLVASVAPALVARGVRAGEIVKVAAAEVGGGGGGRDTLARAGGRDPERLPAAISAARAAIEAALSAETVRVLALDYGRARCGCAVSDPTGVLATPLEPVLAPASRRGLARLRELVAELDAELVLVGLPLSLSGGDSAQTAEARAFAAALARALPVPVELYDERFTTRLAERTRVAPARTRAPPPTCWRAGWPAATAPTEPARG